MGEAAGNPAITEPVQSEDFYNRVRASGTGYFEVGSSVVDRKVGLEYYSFMYGNGHLEMDSKERRLQQGHQRPRNIERIRCPPEPS
jgi:hypothetical protein